MPTNIDFVKHEKVYRYKSGMNVKMAGRLRMESLHEVVSVLV